MTDSPKLYSDLSSWWYLLSAPEEYAEEAAFYRRVLEEASTRPIETLLELGCGGGNNASHMKAFATTGTSMACSAGTRG